VLRLKFRRIERGLSQKRLASLAKVSQPALSLIEAGRVNPTPLELSALGVALGCAPERLLDHVSDNGLPPGAEYRDEVAR
jgi:transcriptional regulator with XRE-family HTH domain